MFSFFKKKGGTALAAVADGLCIPLEEVKDPAFAGKSLGEGVAFVPEDGEIVAPCDGKLSLVTPTLHAFGMECADGLQLMVHIGIDTVALNGEGFEKLAEAGGMVKGIDTTTMLILLNHQDYEIRGLYHGSQMKKGVDTAVEYGR